MILGYWQSFVRSWERHFGLQLATLTVLTCTFTVIVCFYLVHNNLDSVLQHWGKDVRMSLYLEEGLAPAKISSLKEQVVKKNGVQAVTFISKIEAQKRFTKRMKHIAPDLFSQKGSENPLPSSLEIQFDLNDLSGGLANQFKSLSKTFLSWDGVDDVTFGHDWSENYSSFVDKLGIARWTFSILLLLGCLLVVGNSIRTAISQRKIEIEVLELVGATKWMVIKPYLFEGMVMGILAQLLALVVGYVLYAWQTSYLTTGFIFQEISQVISFLDFGQIVFLLLVAAVFGVVGSLICVWNLSTGWSAAQKSQGGNYGF